MNKLVLWANDDVNDDNEFYCSRIEVYESIAHPVVVSLTARSGPGMRLDKPQVQDLAAWLNRWLREHE